MKKRTGFCPRCGFCYDKRLADISRRSAANPTKTMWKEITTKAKLIEAMFKIQPPSEEIQKLWKKVQPMIEKEAKKHG